MQILIVGIGALGGTIAARAIRTGLPVRLAARNTDSAGGIAQIGPASVRHRRRRICLRWLCSARVSVLRWSGS